MIPRQKLKQYLGVEGCLQWIVSKSLLYKSYSYKKNHSATVMNIYEIALLVEPPFCCDDCSWDPEAKNLAKPCTFSGLIKLKQYYVFLNHYIFGNILYFSHNFAYLCWKITKRFSYEAVPNCYTLLSPVAILKVMGFNMIYIS